MRKNSDISLKHKDKENLKVQGQDNATEFLMIQSQLDNIT